MRLTSIRSTSNGTVKSAPLTSAPSRICTVRVSAFQRNAKRLKYEEEGRKGKRREPLVIRVQPDGSDAWRLEPVIKQLKEGSVGIIPTDSLPALVAVLEDRDAVARLYACGELDPKKPLSILCRNFTDISHYTAGFPAPQPGSPNWFNVVRKLLPGPYTFILAASKNLPSQCVDFMKGTTIHRKSVGVRMPGDTVCQAILEGMGGPLLATSVHVPDTLAPDTEVPDAGTMWEQYRDKGVDFIVDIGPRVATQSTVVDMTGEEPEVVRQGKGDASPFEQ